jgi:hypothetical protein
MSTRKSRQREVDAHSLRPDAERGTSVLGGWCTGWSLNTEWGFDQYNGETDTDTHSYAAISVVDVPHSDPHQAALLPRLNDFSQMRFAEHTHQKRSIEPKKNKKKHKRRCTPLA